MNIQEMRDPYSAAPFEPFEIVPPNGTLIPVDHPDFIAFSRDYRMLHFYPLRGGTWHIDIKLIPRVDVPPRNSSPKPKKRK
ncbi:MAG TPA: hypothetical protein VNP98_05225 [Chthoniobacterales bacterium]|nr:hypothetical protein [Chthoniobacterales bacterium]